MAEDGKTRFDMAAALARTGVRAEIVRAMPKTIFFSQGDSADCLFYLQSGRAKLTATSAGGKEATLALLSDGDFIGEDAVAEAADLRASTATAISRCIALKIRRTAMLHAMQQEQPLADFFFNFLLTRSMRVQADLVDQLFNSCEKRLARVLLLMANLDTSEKEQMPIPKISQETLAEMIGTTRSRVSFFMNRFRRQGFIKYDGGIQVHKSLLTILLRD
jgi:CRP-like cAMP-binding protein